MILKLTDLCLEVWATLTSNLLQAYQSGGWYYSTGRSITLEPRHLFLNNLVYKGPSCKKLMTSFHLNCPHCLGVFSQSCKTLYYPKFEIVFLKYVDCIIRTFDSINRESTTLIFKRHLYCQISNHLVRSVKWRYMAPFVMFRATKNSLQHWLSNGRSI